MKNETNSKVKNKQKKSKYIGRQIKSKEAKIKIYHKEERKDRKPRRVEEKYPEPKRCRAPPSGRYRLPSPGGDATDGTTTSKRKKQKKQT